jgi:hypothetical protein
MAAPGEHLDRCVRKMNLHPVAVEFDFVNPPLAARRPGDRGGQCWRNEAGIVGLDAAGRWLALAERRAWLRPAAG